MCNINQLTLLRRRKKATVARWPKILQNNYKKCAGKNIFWPWNFGGRTTTNSGRKWQKGAKKGLENRGKKGTGKHFLHVFQFFQGQFGQKVNCLLCEFCLFKNYFLPKPLKNTILQPQNLFLKLAEKPRQDMATVLKSWRASVYVCGTWEGVRRSGQQPNSLSLHVHPSWAGPRAMDSPSGQQPYSKVWHGQP